MKLLVNSMYPPWTQYHVLVSIVKIKDQHTTLRIALNTVESIHNI